MFKPPIIEFYGLGTEKYNGVAWYWIDAADVMLTYSFNASLTYFIEMKDWCKTFAGIQNIDWYLNGNNRFFFKEEAIRTAFLLRWA